MAVNSGPRTAKGIADALTSALPASQISKLKDASSYTNFTTTSTLPKVVLFTDKSRTSALYKSLSLRFKGRLAFAEVNSKAADVIEEQGVSQFPKLMVLKGEQTEEYSGVFPMLFFICASVKLRSCDHSFFGAMAPVTSLSMCVTGQWHFAFMLCLH